MTFFKKIKKWVIAHKAWSVILALVVLLGGYYIINKSTSTSGQTRYVLGTVEKGTITQSVSGSGVVSASNQIDLKSKASGDVVYLGATVGQQVSAGTLIAELDARDASIALQNAEIALQKLSNPNTSTQTQSENALASAKQANDKAAVDLAKAYDDGFSAVAQSFDDAPSISTGFDDIFKEPNLSDNTARMSGNTALNYRNKAENDSYIAQQALDSNVSLYQTLNRNSPKADIENIISQAYTTAKLFADAIKSLRTFVDYMSSDTDKAADYKSAQDTLSSYSNTIDGHLSSLLAAENNIKNLKNTLAASENDVTLKESQLNQLTTPDTLDLQSAELNVEQKQLAYSNYFIRAPFAGVVAKLDIKSHDSVSSGEVVGTFLSKNQIADVSLNEVDVSGVKVGQKAMLTFDAIPNLSIAGTVSEVDLVGVSTAGVVTYDVQVGFDTQDERIKAGMSVSAAITTSIKQDVLTVPNSAIKTQNGTSYVQMFDAPFAQTNGNQGVTTPLAPHQVQVEVGVSNDSSTEIVSGLNEGDQVVIRTISGTAAAPTVSAPSIFGGGGGVRTGGGGGR